jgi:carbonic anhydrase/acetyltransferase-like protein (isoleucine patch superfamily)
LHTHTGHPCVIGDDCTVGHLAVVHGCTIGNGCLIGMGAVVPGAVIANESILAAGSLVPEGKEFAARSLLVGSPARPVRTLIDDDVQRLIRLLQTYVPPLLPSIATGVRPEPASRIIAPAMGSD